VLGNQFFQLTGGKIIGTDTLENEVYKYDELLQTDSGGLLSLSGMEWDVYTLTVPASSWDLSGAYPFSPFVLLPDASLDVAFASVINSDNSLLFRVTDASGSAVPQTFVKLTNAGGYNETIPTGGLGDPDFGQAFFASLDAGSYDGEATKSGFLTTIFQATASGTLEELLILNPE